VASIRKDHHRQAGEDLCNSLRLEDSDRAATRYRVATSKVRNYQNDQITNGDEGYNGSVLQRVQPSEKGEWDDDDPIYVVSSNSGL